MANCFFFVSYPRSKPPHFGHAAHPANRTPSTADKEADLVYTAAGDRARTCLSTEEFKVYCDDYRRAEKKILDYLDTDKERWNYPPSRIKKSIRGADISDIECVLKHKELYQKETLYSDYDGVSTDKRRQNPPNKVLAHAVGNKS